MDPSVTPEATEPPPDLDMLVQELAARDWRRIAAAETALLSAGEDGCSAILEGMGSPDSRIRRACVRFMDHHGSDRCVPGLTERLLDDPVPRVRREAVHSLSCQRCKRNPLTGDILTMLLHVLRTDPNAKVRREAVYALNSHTPDTQAIALLHELGTGDADAGVRKAAHHLLRLHDPVYRAEPDARVREKCQGRARQSGSESPVQ